MYRVLIAEDEVFVRLGIKMSVEWEKMDMQVIADAANGQQAWDIYEKERPDIILTDIKMPVMDGCEATRQIRHLNREDAKTIPILAATANAFTEDIALTKKAGMNAHISKPIDFEVLKITIARLLQE